MLNTKLVNQGLANDKGIRRTLELPTYTNVGILNKEYIAPAYVKVGLSKTLTLLAYAKIGLSKSLTIPVIVEISLNTTTGLFILNRAREPQAFLPDENWQYSREPSAATSMSVEIPKTIIEDNVPVGHNLYDFFHTQDKIRHADLASFIRITRGGQTRATGKITNRRLGDVFELSAMTEEVLLENNLTPAQYGKVYDGWDLADVARDLLLGWQTLRVKDLSQWQDRLVDSSNVDLTTDPGIVMLAKRSNGRYYESGYIILKFDRQEIVDFVRWDRIRWSADSDGVVSSSIQYSTNGVSFSQPFDGGIPEEIGYALTGDSDSIWVRINLATTDTESEDPEGNKVGVTPAVFSIEVIGRTLGELVEGNIPQVSGVTVKGLNANYTTALKVLVDACNQANFEFTVLDGALSVAKTLGKDLSNKILLHTDHNTEISSLGDDDDFVNILTAYSQGSGINRMEITLRDDMSIQKYGSKSKSLEIQADNLEELMSKARGYLDANNSPATEFVVNTVFDPDREPNFGIGDIVRVADPKTGIVTTSRIMFETREKIDGELRVSFELGSPSLLLSEAIGGKPTVPVPIDPLTPAGVFVKGAIAGLVVGFAQPKGDWAYTECHVSTVSGFTPSSGTLRDSGRQTRFDIMDLIAGARYYVRLVHVDGEGRKSVPSREMSAKALYLPVEVLEDHTIGADKFMANLKPPILVTSKPDFPDLRYPEGTLFFYTVDRKLYESIGEDWEPLNAGKVYADEIVAGIIESGGIKADWYAEIRNTMPYVGLSSLDSSKPIVIPIYVPSETVNIAGAFLSAEARRYRAYAKSAPRRTNPWLTSTASVRDTVHSPQINLKTDWDDTIYLENANTHYHSFDFTHEHDLDFGIHEDTTPSNVRLRINNGSSWSSYINLASAPNTTSPYDLISNANVPKYNNNSSEMNLGSYLSGTGWKYLEFSSARLGMIAWNIILKLDITA